jgi:hypothetical protein
MKRKSLCLGGVIAALLSLSQVRGEEPAMSGPTMPVAPMDAVSTPNPADPLPPTAPPPGTSLTLSSFILRPRSPGCCGPIGANGPIEGEIYVRTGLTFPIGGGFLNNVIDVGWEIEGGGRVLFFNPAEDAAWTVDMGISNVYNNSRDHSTTVTLLNFPVKGANGALTTLPSVALSVRNLNRTDVYLSGGREWYLIGSAHPEDPHQTNWRAGVDVGGAVGSSKMEVVQQHHLTDTISAVVLAAHTDVEIPCGCHGAVLTYGLRLEWTYTFQDILQHNNADVQEIGVLFNAGIRY